MYLFVRIILITLLLILPCLAPAAAADNASRDHEEITSFLQTLFTKRTLLLQNPKENLQPFYLLAEKPSNYAYLNELRRTKYVNAWATLREASITGTEGKIRITRIKVMGNLAKTSVIHSVKISYSYLGKNLPEQFFGIGTRHALTLKKVNDRWHVLREYYSDPLDEDQSVIPMSDVQPTIPNHSQMAKTSHSKWRKPYNRKKVVAYADKYAGIAWMAGNNHRYNSKYKDYTYDGGDCTNFASQALGDKTEGGGLPMFADWFYRPNQGGSVAWVRTDSFKHFLLSSGYGRLVKHGTYEELVKPTSRHPYGAIGELQPGDLIAYDWHGGIDHFCVVTGRDANGYVLVNSHSVDRYHVPWDLGWAKTTKFLLIHIND